MNRKRFSLSPLAAATLLACGGASAQAITAPISSDVDGQVISVEPNQVLSRGFVVIVRLLVQAKLRVAPDT